MKFGMRKPSLKKSFKAKTTGKLKRSFDIVNVNVHWDSVKKEGKLYE